MTKILAATENNEVDNQSDAADIYERLTEAPPPRAQKEPFASFLRRNILELFNLKFALVSFVVNTLRRRYHNSVLGFAWSLLNPLLTIGVMAFIFSWIFHQELDKFTVYLFGALLPWMYIVESLTTGSSAYITNESFLKKLYLPKTFFPLVVVSISTANFMFSMTSLLFLGFCFGLQPSMPMLMLPLATACLFLFNFGMALILAVTTLFLRDLTHIVTVLLGLLFYTMPIMYPIETLPEKYHWVFIYDPFYYFLRLFRILLHEARFPSFEEWGVPLAISASVFLVALMVLRRKENDIVFRL